MSRSSSLAQAERPAVLVLPTATLQRAALWLLAFGGGFALIEPSPYELFFVLAVAVFALTGLRLHGSTFPLALLLIVFNIGGVFALIPFLDEQPSVQFIVISIYLGVTSIFFAMVLLDDTTARLATIRSGYVAAAVCASIAGMLGYFNVAGLGEIFTLYNRASGTFKDPNVLGVFVILPLVWLAQSILTGEKGLARQLTLFGIIFFGGVFLSFSRGAWAHAVGSIGLMTLLTFVSTNDARLRSRIVTMCLLGLALLVVMLAIALSFDAVRKVFEVRASLDQSYDVGVQGRFGSQLRSIPELLERPNGFGPLRFRFHFPEDPHNVYLNAFASYGWAGGLSYAALIVSTVFVGWKVVVTASPWRRQGIAIWSTLFLTILQGLQIDTDHWRHWYLMLGLIWGLLAANIVWERTLRRDAGLMPARGRRSGLPPASALPG